MRKIFTLLLILVTTLTGLAQQYNNEWIQFDQTYFKIKVIKTGLYRIPKSVLDAAGIGNTQVEYFELWNKGQRVPFYPSVSTGVLPSNGYLEFWGAINDGTTDKDMYRDANFQHTDKSSLISDTAIYFLSVNTNQSGFRFTEVVNNVAGNTLPAEPYFMYTAGNYYKNRINAGFAAVVGEYVYSSSYDKGEYWSSGDIKPATPLTTALTGLSVYAAGPGATFRFGASGNALNPRTVNVRINNNLVKDTLMDYFNDVRVSVPVPLSMISSGTASVQFTNTSPISTDRMVISYFEITYPRQFSFGNQKNFEFVLPAKADGYFLQISSFSNGGVAPVLYDLANGERYVGDIATAGVVKFALPGSAVERKLVLVSTEAGNITTVSGLAVRNFTRYADASNQGDYLIVTHPLLYTGSAGNNPVADYKNYRETAQGGSHKVVVADIDELVDQFAYGIAKHPLSVRNFIRYARTNFSQPVNFVFLIGRGMTYNSYYGNRAAANINQLNIVPTFGNPGSDNLLSSPDVTNPIAATPIGRLSVVRGSEVEDYLEKVKEYEAAQVNSPNTLEGREWMKNIVHVTGSSDPYLGTVLCNYMGVYKQMIEDTLFGGTVSTFCKTSTNPVEQLTSGHLEELFEEGISALTYFGHSSTTALEFNIDDPQAYNNPGKYPVFFVNGCNAGDFFRYYPARLVANETLSEKFTLAKQRGTIAFVASTHYGIVNYLNLYLTNLYGAMSGSSYGKSLGALQSDALQRMVNATGPYDFYARMHAEEITLHGDPALKINSSPQPDYVVEEPQIKISPTFISVAESSFALSLRMVNIGKAIADSLKVEIRRQFPDGSVSTIFSQKIRGVRYEDFLTMEVPITASHDEGLNKIIVTVDPDNEITEVDENNNSAVKEFFIYEDEVRPAFPYEYSIVNSTDQKFFASTANPFSEQRDYILEMDTTMAFNSALKVSKTANSIGGVIEFVPGMAYLDSTVYYWRVSQVPTGNGGNYHWNTSSFIYINGGSEGFNQSHYFQQAESTGERLSLDSASRQWKFGKRTNYLHALNSIYGYGGFNDADFAVSVNSFDYIRSACVGNSLIYNIFDPVTFKPWKNVDDNGNNLYRYGSGSANCAKNRNYNFEFSYMTQANRKLIMDFMDSIPIGHYVVVRSMYFDNPNSFSTTWRADTLAYGSNKSLYHKLLEAGFMDIDSIISPRAWILIYQKDVDSFIPKYKFTPGIYDRISVSADCPTQDTLGYISSPLFGPAKQWHEVVWRGTDLETPSHDNPSVDVIGVDNNNFESLLYTLDKNTQNFDVSSIDAGQYPYLRLRMRNIDSINLTPYQLDYWRILYDPVPEGALAANLFFTTKDSLEVGEMLKFGIAFKNISKTDFDSLAVKVNVIDNNNVTRPVPVSRLKPLQKGDTVILQFELDTKDFPGENTLFVEINPDNDQPEQQHFNNFLYRNFYARLDKTNPVMDVTFDGVHILNRDIVSAQPRIQIKLQDEAKYLLLNDTALSSVQVKFPDGTLRTYNFDGDTLRFTPATSGDNNSAIIDFAPSFLDQVNPEGDEYELIVKGKDRSNNKAGNFDYRIAFRVISKPMISNMLNYPNPFTTSTAFVFTITGSEVPQNIKIQILTVTGKIVREITKDELGPLHIGRNITEFKWNGTDQYGQRLANGVYLYRVVTTLNGRPMDKYKADGDNTDKFFNNGYGKMYLMR